MLLQASVFWQRMRQMQEENMTVHVKVESANRGGLLVKYGPYEGFTPVSQFGPVSAACCWGTQLFWPGGVAARPCCMRPCCRHVLGMTRCFAAAANQPRHDGEPSRQRAACEVPGGGRGEAAFPKPASPCASQWRWSHVLLIRICYPSQEKERLVFSNKRVAGATTADLQGYKVRLQGFVGNRSGS